MLRPTAAAAVWLLLLLLGLVMSLAAEDNADFSLCSHCFFRQSPPRGGSTGQPLTPRCHTLPGGRTLATLHTPTCDTAVYSAFHLGHGWTQGQEEEDVVTIQDGDANVLVPALLRGGDAPPPEEDSPLQQWDSTVASLVLVNFAPQCSSSGGDLYVLIGAGGLEATECQAEPLWCALYCAVPGGSAGFSLGLVSETDGGVREVSVDELEATLGLEELFSDENPGAAGVLAMVVPDSDANVDTVAEDASGADESSSSQREEQYSVRETRAAQEESAEALDEAVKSTAEIEKELEANSSSTVIYILSTALSILKAPLRPVVSTVTQLPGQVSYVLQEDLGVLSALPGDTFSLLHLLTSDILSWTGSAVETVYGVGESCFCSAYYCTSSMLGALYDSCYTGVTGVGTLAGDTVGIFGDGLNNAWWVTKLFGGRLWEQSEDYVGTVVSEMGGQTKALGGGLGRLVWRSGKGVGNVFFKGGGLIFGVFDMLFGAARDVVEQESES
ncbi:uncharacterized protein LOC128768547 [Synchiropus splendidus]|uniref:uncharacterized protein LOC128768547 n=1 Tax=Synchiropus splendidus TaxID=270530 RepID=UPI00237EB32A|nr:uncharacterized protein LOC128768547 [Synchiropus splendidus]